MPAVDVQNFRLTATDLRKSVDLHGLVTGVTLVSLLDQTLQKKVDALGGDAALGGLDRKEAKAWHYRNGTSVCYNSTLHAAFEAHGAIQKKWMALGGMDWGVPCTDETTTPDGVGRYNHFSDNGASIYWTPSAGAFAIYGEIRKKWASLGWEQSPLGYPVTDETGTPDGVGRYNHFSNAGSIYWTPSTGANTVWGDIRKKWESLGWERSYLGYPTSDEVDFADGGRANSFQNGGAYWWADTGVIDLKGVVVQYLGLYCFGETDWDQSSNSDEPYVIISTTTPSAVATVTTQVYGDVDGGEARPDLLEIYRGVPYGINIGAVLMEHDFGDPAKYKEDIQKIVMGVHSAGTVALGLIPIVGPIIAAVAGPALGSLMPKLGGAINDLFDWGDDRIGSSTQTIGAKQMIVLATRTQNQMFKGIAFKIESQLISGSGASYKAYFSVTPA